MEEIQGFGLQIFQVECPIAGLDDTILYIIKDCIECQKEALVQRVTKIKEILDNLKLLDEIIQGDLKWFKKHYSGTENDSIS